MNNIENLPMKETSEAKFILGVILGCIGLGSFLTSVICILFGYSFVGWIMIAIAVSLIIIRVICKV